MSARVLTQRELNRALLARQLLLTRAATTPTRALARVAGVQAQDAIAPYIGLWTRVEGVDRRAVTEAIRRRAAVKATLMRATLHLVSARDYRLLLPAMRPALRGAARRHVSDGSRAPDAEAFARRVLAVADRPRSRAELMAELGGEEEWWRAFVDVPLVHAPSGRDGWAFGRRPAYVAAERWLGRREDTAPSGRDPTAYALARYLKAFGPASLQDAAVWSGLTLAALRPAALRLAPRLRRFQDARGRELLDVRGAPLPRAETPAPARLLPAFDNTLLSHADRTRIVADEHRPLVINGGLVEPVILVDGLVAGVWHLRNGRVDLEPFGRLPRVAQRELRAEARSLEAFVA